MSPTEGGTVTEAEAEAEIARLKAALAFERVAVAELRAEAHTLRTRLHFERLVFPPAEVIDTLTAYADFYGGTSRRTSPGRERALQWLAEVRRVHEEGLAPAEAAHARMSEMRADRDAARAEVARQAPVIAAVLEWSRHDCERYDGDPMCGACFTRIAESLSALDGAPGGPQPDPMHYPPAPGDYSGWAAVRAEVTRLRALCAEAVPFVKHAGVKCSEPECPYEVCQMAARLEAAGKGEP